MAGLLGRVEGMTLKTALTLLLLSAEPLTNQTSHHWTIRLVNESTHELKLFEVRQTAEIEFEALKCTVKVFGKKGDGAQSSTLSTLCTLKHATGRILASFGGSPCLSSSTQPPLLGDTTGALTLISEGSAKALAYSLEAKCTVD